MTRRLRSAGFTLLEVMIGLAILGAGLTMLLRSVSQSVMASNEAHMMGVVTDLSRGKMYEVEETLLKDGFLETDQSEENKDFTEQGWPDIHYDVKVQQVELPSFDTLQAMAKGQAQAGSAALAAAGSAKGSGFGSGSGSASPDDLLGGFQNSALGGMLGMFGGGAGGTGDINEARGASLIGAQYSMFQDILKVSIRKVTLTVRYKVLGRDRDLTTVAYFTDQAAMDKVLKGFGSSELPDDSAGAGGAGGAGSGSGGARPTGNPGSRGGTGSGGKL